MYGGRFADVFVQSHCFCCCFHTRSAFAAFFFSHVLHSRHEKNEKSRSNFADLRYELQVVVLLR